MDLHRTLQGSRRQGIRSRRRQEELLGQSPTRAFLDQADEPVLLEHLQVVVDLLAAQRHRGGERRRGSRFLQQGEHARSGRFQCSACGVGVIDDGQIVDVVRVQRSRGHQPILHWTEILVNRVGRYRRGPI